jgi:thymidylate synthase (FAD)
MNASPDQLPADAVPVLDHGFVRLDAVMADDLSVANAARVSFARRKDVLDESDEGLIRFLMRDLHGTPFEHNAFRYHIRCPIFVAREWFRHRIGCLTGDTVVTFVDINGHSSKSRNKTVDDLWRMWSQGEQDGHALRADTREALDRLIADGLSRRHIAERLGIGRRAIITRLEGKRELRDARWRVRRMRLRVLNEATGLFEEGHVADVLDKGVQPVYRLTLADGKEITLTENHRVLTSQGWQRMSYAVGLTGEGERARMTRECELMTNGVVAYRDREWLLARREEGMSVGEIAREAGCSYHTVRKWLRVHGLQFTRVEMLGRTPWNKGKSGYRTNLVMSESHRESIRRARSGPRSNFWRGGVASDRASIGRWTREQAPRVHAKFDYTCQRCARRGGRLYAHHVVPVWLDLSLARDFENLVSLCGVCHRAIHKTADTERAFAKGFSGEIIRADIEPPAGRRGFRLTAVPVRVVSIAYVGLRPTYDLSVAGEWHNFVANGVVVHNSFNEFSLRYARATDHFYVPEPDDVRSQIGKPGAYTFEPVDPELAERTREELQAVYDHAYETYERLVEAGVAREVARSVLPVGAYTQFYWTVNARALMNFVSLRNSEFAQLEIRRYAEVVEALFAERMPVTHAAFVAGGRVAP